MSFTSIDLPNLLFEMALFAILGLGFETVFYCRSIGKAIKGAF